MENFIEIKKEIIENLNNVTYIDDLSDIGNEIGIVIAKYLNNENTVEDFIHGIKHGISLIDGSHP